MTHGIHFLPQSDQACPVHAVSAHHCHTSLWSAHHCPDITHLGLMPGACAQGGPRVGAGHVFRSLEVQPVVANLIHAVRMAISRSLLQNTARKKKRRFIAVCMLLLLSLFSLCLSVSSGVCASVLAVMARRSSKPTMPRRPCLRQCDAWCPSTRERRRRQQRQPRN